MSFQNRQIDEESSGEHRLGDIHRQTIIGKLPEPVFLCVDKVYAVFIPYPVISIEPECILCIRTNPGAFGNRDNQWRSADA